MAQIEFADCLAIQCGAVSQQEAGFDKLVKCSDAGYVGARSPFDPLCDKYRVPASISVPVLPGLVLPPPDSTANIVTPPVEHITPDMLTMALPGMPVTIRPQGYCGQLPDVEYVEQNADTNLTLGGVSSGLDSWACRVGAWANTHPWLAVAVLAATYAAVHETAKQVQRRKAARS